LFKACFVDGTTLVDIYDPICNNDVDTNGVTYMKTRTHPKGNQALIRADHSWLDSWLQSASRKPLVLRGARQVGKSFLARELAARNNLRLCELNFEAKPKLNKIFQDSNTAELVPNLEHELGIRLSEETLLFLDEIQSSPAALASLRYLYENHRDIPVVSAGSLLEFTLNDTSYSMPVGRVTFRWIHPLTFREFLANRGKSILLDEINRFIKEPRRTISTTAHEALSKELALYCFVGGMPEANNRFLASTHQTDGLLEAAHAHEDIVLSYRSDFSKYRKRLPLETLHAVFDSITRVAGDTRTKYSNIDDTLRATALRKALDALDNAGIIRRVVLSHATALPISSQEDASVFKIIPLDVGLFCTQTFGEANSPRPVENLFDKWTGGDLFERRWVGQIAEIIVGQALMSQQQATQKLNYWLREGKSNNAEVDYLTQIGTKIIPIEVKAGASGSLRSLHLFMATKALSHAVRFDLNQPSIQNINLDVAVGDKETKNAKYQLLNLPLYLADWASELLQNLL
jgi:predicted AAA+ superfamily ATPase